MTRSAPPTVSLVSCRSYERSQVEDAVRKSVDLLGGMSAFVSDGEKVLIKPNMLAARTPEKAVTTHPEIVRATIRLVREVGGIPVVGDSPAGPSTDAILRHLADKTGIATVCEEASAPFALFTDYENVACNSGRVAQSFTLTKTLAEVDMVISLAKLKTHSFTGFTGGVKNLFGLVHGLRKAEYHMRMRDVRYFSEMLVDLAECVKPRLTIMDAVVGMDGDGPSAGRLRGIESILASANPHALDVVALELVGVDPKSVWTTNIAMERGLVPARGAAEIDVIGGNLEEMGFSDFRMPSGTTVFGRIPVALGGFVSEGVVRKPIFIHKRCVRCGRCTEICPAEVLRLLDEEDRREIAIQRGGCIRCYCCHEVCPENAVALKRMPLRSWGRPVWARLRRRKHHRKSPRSRAKE